MIKTNCICIYHKVLREVITIVTHFIKTVFLAVLISKQVFKSMIALTENWELSSCSQALRLLVCDTNARKIEMNRSVNLKRNVDVYKLV